MALSQHERFPQARRELHGLAHGNLLVACNARRFLHEYSRLDLAKGGSYNCWQESCNEDQYTHNAYIAVAGHFLSLTHHLHASQLFRTPRETAVCDPFLVPVLAPPETNVLQEPRPPVLCFRVEPV